MNTITIDTNELADLIISSAPKAGLTEWSIMAHITDGTVDLRHNTYDNSNYIELCNMYYGIDEEWLGINDDDYNEDDAKNFLISDTIPSWLSRGIEQNGETYNIGDAS